MRLLKLLPLLAVVACQADVTDVTDVTDGQASRLDDVLASQPDDVQARYSYRNPKETMDFFGIEPGMTVVEGLPGQGWYTKLLLPYLGEEGTLIAADYAMDMWPLFPFGTEEFIATRSQWHDTFKIEAAEWGGDGSAAVKTFRFGSMPDELAGTADAVFFARVLHNLARFESEGEYLTIALNDANRVLKPGGVFGVVQHEARDDKPDDWADGGRGYLKKSFVIAQAENAGFVFEAESDVNENPNDQPGADDVVWRLPPSLSGSAEDPERRAAMQAIGESNRMTLRFRKPE